MKIDVLTIFPEFFREVFDFGIIRRAKLAEIVEINIHDIREYTLDKHRKVDDRPFGGGDGMVLTPEPIFRAIENLTGTSERENYPEKTRVVLLTPQGRVFKQAVAKEFADEAEHLILICGRYEGVDERVNEMLVTDEISIGDYVFQAANRRRLSWLTRLSGFCRTLSEARLPPKMIRFQAEFWIIRITHSRASFAE